MRRFGRKSFEIELGPMRNKEAKDISQGKKLSLHYLNKLLNI